MDIPNIDFQPGQTYRAHIPFSNLPMKIHIMYVLPSFYKDSKLIVYRVFGKHKQWWHEFMEIDDMLEFYINKAKNENNRNK
jgi:hypothetical protein